MGRGQRAALGLAVAAAIGYLGGVDPVAGMPPRDHGDRVIAFHPVIRDFPAATFAPHPQPVVVGPRPLVETGRPLASHTPSVRTQAGSVADAKAYALDVLGPLQYDCLDQIAIRESNWSPYDLNSSSGAYGIPQAVPGSKMGSAGADWRTNPVTQVRWMIGYVDTRYGSACGAWAFWQEHRWY